MVKAIEILSASMGIDFEADPLPKITSKLAENGVSVFRVNLDDALVCFCFEPDAVKTINAAIESINATWDEKILSAHGSLSEKPL